MSREDERVCKASFGRYLARTVGARRIRWGPGDDPPDYYLQVDSRRFAVEVTVLVPWLSTTSRRISEVAYDESMRRLAAEIEAEGVAQGVLTGTYLLHFLGPFDDYADVRAVITKEAMRFIRRTRDVETSDWEAVFSSRGRTCALCKAAAVGRNVYHVADSRDPFRVVWEGEWPKRALELLQPAIRTKKRKLGFVMDLAKILLLGNGWALGDRWVYERCVSDLDSLDFFHSVFVVQSKRAGYFLYTQEPAWREN